MGPITGWWRQGTILTVRPGHGWWKSHAQLPTVLPLSDRLWRIYFAARDERNRGHIVAADVDPGDGMRVVAEHYEPLLELGAPGTFDHSGAGPACAVRVEGQVRLYYFGIALKSEVRATATIGLAVSDDGLRFRRAFEGPVLGQGPLDPYLTTAPCVRESVGGFDMWYVSGTGWPQSGGQPEPVYGIRRARSQDGLFWDPRTRLVLAPSEPEELGLARPWVRLGRDGGRLWLSRRGEAFRTGGAEAYHIAEVPLDGNGEVAGRPSPIRFENPPGRDDFDSWMQAYACILPYGSNLIMIYNGNGFGETGIGWARCEGAAQAIAD